MTSYSPNVSEISFTLNQCFLDALFNKVFFISENSPKHYRIVVGSLGFGLDKNPWYEFGFKKDRKNVRDYTNAGGMDVHCWLEDTDGNIMDKFHKTYKIIASVRGKKMLFNKECIFNKDKKTLKRMGLHYKEIDNRVLQKKLFHNVIKNSNITQMISINECMGMLD